MELGVPKPWRTMPAMTRVEQGWKAGRGARDIVFHVVPADAATVAMTMDEGVWCPPTWIHGSQGHLSLLPSLRGGVALDSVVEFTID